MTMADDKRKPGMYETDLQKEENMAEVTQLRIELNNGATLPLVEEDIDDILVAAFEGGINYWCSEVHVVGEYLGEYASDQISRGGELDIYDMEEETYYRLTLKKFLKGLKMWLEESGYKCLEQEYGGMYRLDVGDIDACRADDIVQLAILGEVVYG